MNDEMCDRLRGVAVGAAVGDALGMPLEFGPAHPLDRLERDMRPGRLPAGAFTDDTEMALALADSLVVNLGSDADTAGAVVGALAGAAHGLSAIPSAWRAAIHGEWPLRSGVRWDEARLIALADRLAGKV